MTSRPAKNQQRRGIPEEQATPPDTVPNTLGPIAGIAPAKETRSGEDTRRRGWFWHWNSIVTQYAPLIGLKGVGLVNSYTVWTDRREESPHRGYAFPSQQREADFYGEDRAELITINKILVALDLIEIRKEMVLRADDQGRRWRVPHNFYRVKDHNDGFHLTTDHVLKVIELADRDKTVYRYIRRIFSDRFAPIDSDNVWVRILPEIRQNETWQRLAARAAHEEDRASARTRAGHAARKANLVMPIDGDQPALVEGQNDSGNDTPPKGKTTSVANTNKGFPADVEPINKGFQEKSTTSVAPANSAGLTGVAPINTTYDKDELLTTTTTTPGSDDIDSTMTVDVEPDVLPRVPTVASAGPGGLPAPMDAAGEAATIQAFEDANGKRSTPAQRQMLAKLAADFEEAASREAHPELQTSWDWLTAAIYEAVEAGSSFVAPRRLREILTRWEREGLPGKHEDRRPHRHSERSEAESRNLAMRDRAPFEKEILRQAQNDGGPVGGPDLPLPHGFGSRRTWEFTISLLSTAIERERLAELFTGSYISGYDNGEVTLSVPDPIQAERIMGEYRELIARKLGEAMRRPVRLAVLGPDNTEASNDDRSDEVTAPTEDEAFQEDRAIPSFVVPECGLPSGQVWAAVLDEIAHAGTVSRANLDTWLRQTTLIGRAEDGSLIIGVPHTLAQQRITTRLLSPLRFAVRAVVGPKADVEIVVTREWLRVVHDPIGPGVEGDEAAAGD